MILVTVDEPQGAIFGGTVAAPVFQQIARFALQYLEVPPDNPSDLAGTRDGDSDRTAATSATAPTDTSSRTRPRRTRPLRPAARYADLLPAASIIVAQRRQCLSHKSPAFERLL